MVQIAYCCDDLLVNISFIYLVRQKFTEQNFSYLVTR